MSISAIEFVLLGGAAFVLSGVLTWPVRKLAIWVGAMDKPTMDRKTQKDPVPYLGGVSIALTVSLITYASIIYSDNTKTTFPLVTYLLLPAVFMGAMGLVDDLRGLQPMPRLIFQTIVAVIVSVVLIQTKTIGTPLDNTFLVSTLGITLIAYAQGQELIAALAVVTAGATIGFLLWNKSPAKIYMGDAGALFLGIIVSVLTIRLNPGINPLWNSIALLPMLLAVPILDTCIAVFSRIKRGISPFTGGKDHLSHRLMRKGISKRNTAYCLWAMQASFVALALVTYKWTASLGTPAIALAGIYWLGAFVWFWRIPSSD